MIKYKPLVAVPGKSYKITPVKISKSDEPQLRKLVEELIKAIIKNIENGKKSGSLKKQENLYVIRRVGSLQYTSHGVSSGYMLKRVTKKDWINAIHQCKQDVLKLPEYEKLNTFLDKILNEDQKYYPAVLAQTIVDEHFKNTSDSSKIKKIAKTFLDDLKYLTPTSYAKIEIFGLHLGAKKISLSKKLSIDRVTTKDLDFTKPLSFEDFDKPFPSAYLRFEGTNYKEVHLAVKKTIVALRLYKIGSILQGKKETHSDSVIFKGAGTEYPGSLERRSSSCVLNRTECKRFPQFWIKIGKYLTSDTTYGFDKKYQYLDTAFERFSESLLKGEVESRISNAIMCLEALYLHETNEEISYRLRNRIARLLSLQRFDPEKILRNISLSYSIRSAYVHGSELSKYNQNKLLKINESKYLAQEILLKNIQEYARISLLNLIIFNKHKSELIRLLDLAQIDDDSLKNLKNQTKKIKTILKMLPKFEPFATSN